MKRLFWCLRGLLLLSLAVGLSADAGQRPRQKLEGGSASFAKGGGAAPGWTDPTGVAWDYAWAFDDAAGPRTLGGGVDLVLLNPGAGPPTLSPAPATLDPGGLGLGPSMLDVTGLNYRAGSATNLLTPGPVHVRIVCAPPVSAVGNVYIGENGDPDGAWMRASLGSAAGLGRTLTRSYNDSGFLATQNILNVPDGDPRVIDYVTWQDGVDYRTDLYVNGQVLSSGGSASTWTNVSQDVIDLTGLSGQIAFLGVRRQVVTPAQHDASVDAVIDGLAIDGRPWEYAWAAADAPATPGDLPALAGGIPLTLTSGYEYTKNNPTTGLSAAGIGTARVGQALRRTVGTSYLWTANNAAFGAAAGYSAWYRFIVAGPASGTDRWLNRSTASPLDRLLLNDAGRGVFQSFPGLQAAAPDQGLVGFSLIDVIVDNSAGEIRLHQQGAVVTTVITTPIRALANDNLLLQQGVGDMVFMGMTSDISTFSEVVHAADVALIEVAP